MLQQAEEVGKAVGHDSPQGAVLPQCQQTSVSVLQQTLCLLGDMKGHGTQLLEQLTVPGLQRKLYEKTMK